MHIISVTVQILTVLTYTHPFTCILVFWDVVLIIGDSGLLGCGSHHWGSWSSGMWFSSLGKWLQTCLKECVIFMFKSKKSMTFTLKMMFLWNVGNHTPGKATSHPRRPESSTAPLWTPWVSHPFMYLHFCTSYHLYKVLIQLHQHADPLHFI